MATRGPQNGQRGLERGLTLGSWALNKVFDPSTPSMRKGDNGGETSTRVVHRCVRTNISAISDIFDEMNEKFINHAKIWLRYARFTLRYACDISEICLR